MAETLRSVGIDVGTSTTQVVFSALTVTDTAGLFRVPNAQITATRVLYQSPVYPTPLLDEKRIDAAALRTIVAAEYRNAGIAPGETDTGAVIITGESARKENARAVLENLRDFAGKFVVATAGPDLESRIAGQGSGAQALSRARRCSVVNLDIGGGTTNLALFDSGKFVASACYDIGGKMLRFSADGRLTTLSPAAQDVARQHNLSLTVGQVPQTAQLAQLAKVLTEALESAALGKASPLLERLRTAGSSRHFPTSPYPRITLSGGVADCVFDETLPDFAYGDFGVLLGRALRQSALFAKAERGGETIRATVIGAGSHTTELSGSTVHYSSADLFPLQNVPVFAVSERQEAALWRGDCDTFAQDFAHFLTQTDSPHAVCALQGRRNPGYTDLTRLARALVRSLSGSPLLVILHEDNAKALGLILSGLLRGTPLVVLDNICAGANTYLDIGQPILGGLTLPVVVKTLIMGSAT
ncbi:MAG: ethanolamine ammonia-lyase reactivating factor EutA [Oscillospiraceae bacterium]|jgi:ethanolamine utilization protein EutA|nr:ethanolamine ammonia-lyase reactivating factor EutA [Oscillospiraceae bacterium]